MNRLKSLLLSFQFRLFVTIIFALALLIYNDPGKVIAILADTDPVPLIFALLCTPLVILPRILRWGLLIRELKLPFRTVAVSYLMGLGLSTFTPSGAGEVGRIAFLPSTKGQRLSLSTKVVVDKILDVVVIVFGAGISLLIYVDKAPVIAAWVVLCVAALAMGLWLLRKWEFKHQFVSTVWNSFTEIPANILWMNLGLSILGFVLLYSQLYIVFLAFRPDVPLEISFFFSLITLSTILPISLNGLGLRELVATVVLSAYDIPSAVVVNAVFLHFLIVTIPPVLVGLGLWYSQKKPETSLEHE
jgi:glycosyltransferase 2 family protein